LLDTLTVILVLAAALLHASWHAMVKSGANQIAVLAGMGLVAASASVCALPFLPLPAGPVWAVIGCALFLHLGYKLALARSYALGDLGQAFPFARGFVPLFATAIAFTLLGEIPTSGQLVGIAIVSAGLIWLAADSIRGGIDRRVFIATLVAGLTVAGYSVLDAYGARLAGNWVSFTAWLIVVDSGSFLLLAHAMQGRRLWDELWLYRWRTLVSGLLGLVAFSVFLWALSRSAVGGVTALRESSVLFATLIGMVFFGERRSAHRIGAVALMVLGLGTIAVLR
jgi:uncharacterized membrane protein